MSTLIWVPENEVYLNKEGKDKWNFLYGKTRKEVYLNKEFPHKETVWKKKDYFLFPARAAGIVMRSLPEEVTFPLLEMVLCLGGIEKVVIILVDNTELTTPVHRNNPFHPYWGDTSSLREIITTKYEKEKEFELEFVTVYNSNSPTVCLQALSGTQGEYLLGPAGVLTQTLKGLTGAKQVFLNPFTEDLEICR